MDSTGYVLVGLRQGGQKTVALIYLSRSEPIAIPDPTCQLKSEVFFVLPGNTKVVYS